MFKLSAGITLAFFLVGICFAAPAPPVQGPEYIGNFEAVSKAGVRTDLERLKGVVQSKIKALGYGGFETFTEYSGARSPVRFSSADPVIFVVRFSQGADPQGLISIKKLTVRKNNRISMNVTSSFIGMSPRNVSDAGNISYNAQKYGTEFFKIIPITPLPPGEYVISMGADGSLFGVD